MSRLHVLRGERSRAWLTRLGGALAGGGLALAALWSPLLALALALALGGAILVARRRLVVPWLRATGSGALAVGLKELRGRMRGRRAFTILTIYLALLAGFAWAVIKIQERGAANQSLAQPGSDVFPGAYLGVGQVALGAQIGQTLFAALLFVLMLLVVFLAPAFTAGAISGERERQTFELLAATPLSGSAVVAGKLLSALGYLFLLIVASVPLMSLVFTFGGVAVDDIVRAYVVLVTTALAFGALGLFLSALVRRTGAATILSYLGVLTLTLASLFVFIFWGAMVNYQPGATTSGRNPIAALGRQPPEALVWLNPMVAVADLTCSTGSSALSLLGCGVATYVTNTPYFGQAQSYEGGSLRFGVPGASAGADETIFIAVGDDRGAVQITADAQAAVAQPLNPFGVPRDLIWPRIAVAQIVTALILALASVALVSPTRPVLRLGAGSRRRRPDPAPEYPGRSEVRR